MAPQPLCVGVALAIHTLSGAKGLRPHMISVEEHDYFTEPPSYVADKIPEAIGELGGARDGVKVAVTGWVEHPEDADIKGR